VDAVRALVHLGDPRAINPLLAVLEVDPSPQVRRHAAGGQWRWQDPRILPALVRALRDSDLAVRIAAASAVGQFDDPAAAEPLVELLGDLNNDQDLLTTAAAG